MASVRLSTEQANFDTDAEFQSWINAMSAALTTAGLVKTSDTGQVALPATITRAVSTAFEIRKLNDVPSATYPIFFKIFFQCLASTRPQISVDIGTGSDGAGNLTGVIATGLQAGPGNTPSSSDLADYLISVGEGHFHYYFSPASQRVGWPNYAAWFSFERSMDETGSLHPEEGAYIINTPSNGIQKRIYAHTFGIVVQAQPQTHGFISRQAMEVSDDMFNNLIAVEPNAYIVRARLRWTRHAVIHSGRLGYASVVPCTHLGADRTFFSLDQSFVGGWAGSTTVLSSGCLLPWYV